jgi:hypothetical protein
VTPREASSAIHKRFMDYVHPFSGFLVGVGVTPTSVIVMCRREPRQKEKDECIRLADDVSVEFKITGDLQLCGETSET